jgi:hypothetical protein
VLLMMKKTSKNLWSRHSAIWEKSTILKGRDYRTLFYRFAI